MLLRTTKSFRDRFRRLPAKVQQRAERAYQSWPDDPWQTSLHFKEVAAAEGLYSVRIGISWRALGYREGDTISWFWIGPHAEYDKLLAQL